MTSPRCCWSWSICSKKSCSALRIGMKSWVTRRWEISKSVCSALVERARRRRAGFEADRLDLLAGRDQAGRIRAVALDDARRRLSAWSEVGAALIRPVTKEAQECR